MRGRGWDRDSQQLDWLKLLWNLSLIMSMFSWNLLCKMGHCWCWVEQMCYSASFFFFNSSVLALYFCIILCFCGNWCSNFLSYLLLDFYPVCRIMYLSKSTCWRPVECVSVVALWSCISCTRECTTRVLPAFLLSQLWLKVSYLSWGSTDFNWSRIENIIVVWLETLVAMAWEHYLQVFELPYDFL